MSNNNSYRKGLDLKNKKDHDHDHEYWTRRSFLNTLGVGGAASFFLNKLPINAMAANPMQAMLSGLETDRVLVLIRLKGGNDGLNTIIPLTQYGTYQSLRPFLHIAQNDLINLNPEIAVPYYMGDINTMWNDGHMKVVQGIGYPGQSLSHFTSSDIWASAGNSGEGSYNTGFIGRFFDNEYPDFLLNPPETPPAIQIGSQSNLLFTGTQTQMGMSVVNPTELYEIAATGSLYDTEMVPDCYYGEQLAFSRTIANTTFIYADVIKNAFDSTSNIVNYDIPTLDYNNFGEQLSVIARLIKGNLGTKIYLVELGDFDTHSQQNPYQQILVQALSQGIKLFFEDLNETGHGDKVLAMTISEFGRRVQENGGQGTDHGAAAPMMLFSESFDQNEVFGSNTDFSNLDNNGNLAYETDFRSVYATVLENWLCVDPLLVDAVLENSYSRISNLVPGCDTISSNEYFNAYQFYHQARYISNGDISINYTLPTSGRITISLFNISGQFLFDLLKEDKTSGEYKVNFSPRQKGLPLGNYIYKIYFKGKSMSGKISVF